MSELVGSSGTPVELARRLAELGHVDMGHGCWSYAGGTPRHWTELVGVVPPPASPAAPHGFASTITGTVAISAAAAGVTAALQGLDILPPSVRPYVGLVLLALAAALTSAKGMLSR